MRADGRIDKHDETNIRFSQFFERAYKSFPFPFSSNSCNQIASARTFHVLQTISSGMRRRVTELQLPERFGRTSHQGTEPDPLNTVSHSRRYEPLTVSR